MNERGRQLRRPYLSSGTSPGLSCVNAICAMAKALVTPLAPTSMTLRATISQTGSLRSTNPSLCSVHPELFQVRFHVLHRIRALLWRLLSRGVGPIVQVRRCIGLTRFAQHIVPLDTGREFRSLGAGLLGEGAQPIFEGLGLLVATPLFHWSDPQTKKSCAWLGTNAGQFDAVPQGETKTGHRDIQFRPRGHKTGQFRGSEFGSGLNC